MLGGLLVAFLCATAVQANPIPEKKPAKAESSILKPWKDALDAIIQKASDQAKAKLSTSKSAQPKSSGG
jgi:hypothetical protein